MYHRGKCKVKHNSTSDSGKTLLLCKTTKLLPGIKNKIIKVKRQMKNEEKYLQLNHRQRALFSNI